MGERIEIKPHLIHPGKLLQHLDIALQRRRQARLGKPQRRPIPIHTIAITQRHAPVDLPLHRHVKVPHAQRVHRIAPDVRPLDARVIDHLQHRIPRCDHPRDVIARGGVEFQLAEERHAHLGQREAAVDERRG